MFGEFEEEEDKVEWDYCQGKHGEKRERNERE
jgi:hypothetical protein